MQEPPEIDWGKLADKFGFKLVKVRATQATVEATHQKIQRLREQHPEINVTVPKKYRTLTQH